MNWTKISWFLPIIGMFTAINSLRKGEPTIEDIFMFHATSFVHACYVAALIIYIAKW